MAFWHLAESDQCSLTDSYTNINTCFTAKKERHRSKGKVKIWIVNKRLYRRRLVDLLRMRIFGDPSAPALPRQNAKHFPSDQSKRSVPVHQARPWALAKKKSEWTVDCNPQYSIVCQGFVTFMEYFSIRTIAESAKFCTSNFWYII